MSIKDLFGKTSRNLEDTVEDVESVTFVEEKSKQQERYQPQVDFSNPENFVYYGSAELYYDAAIRRIYEDYPYDGSKAEQIEFEEKASALERWVFENKYPKTTGHVKLGTTANLGALSGIYRATTVPEYIRVWGGLHTNEAASSLSEHVATSAKYDNDNNRNQNWNCDFTNGVTVEFWMKKDSTTINEAEVILDLWNGSATPANSRMLIEFIDFSTPYIRLSLQKDTLLEQKVIDISSHYSDSTWMHFAFSLIKEDSTLQLRVYVNGAIISTPIPFSNTFEFEGKMDAFLGALQTSIGSYGATGSGKFQGYLDEFRFWKTKRTSRQIKLNWFQSIGGGANTDDATSDLGVYLKFNEGIVENNQVDNTVLDYSGRMANGLWVGYPGSSARSPDSAMETQGFTETPSPIIYKEHPLVSALIEEMKTSGQVYDANKGQSFYRSMPTWLQEEDDGNLRYFSQILASYMDTLHVQIKELTELKTKRYSIDGLKSSTLASELLKDKGFIVSDMFASSEVHERLAGINLKDGQYESEISEIKNIIYTNIYNNLEKIYKTKGTEGSIRNLIRCFGIDDELIRLNLYTDGGTQYLTDKSRVTSVKKKYINFNSLQMLDSSIFNDSSSNNANTFIYELSNGDTSAFTLEVDIVVPHKKEVGESGYFATPFLSASVMGFHEANVTNSSDLTWGSKDLQVYLVRDALESPHAKFVLKSESGINLESDYIYDIYSNEHYNVALRIKPQTYPFAGGVTNTTPDYDIELYAVTTNFGEVEEEVVLSTTLPYIDGEALLACAKRVYVGAHRLNFTGNTIQQTDIQVGAVRAWLDYISNDEILQHNKDVLNFGARKSTAGANPYTINNVQIPTQALTILNWDFDTVTSSDISGEFVVEDTTAWGSDVIYGWVDQVTRRECNAKGFDFPLSTSSFVSNEFIQAYKKQLPEAAYDAQNIYIKGEQEINFSDDDDVSDSLFVMEKSPAAMISEEMLKSFSTTLEFANLFAKPVDKYRLEYKDMAHAKQLFFEKVDGDIDFDRFFEYFKWIDSSLSSMVNQLVPMSANFSGGIVDIIEPHLLERDKYQRQIGLLNTITSTEASIRGVQELKYNWRFGHAPLPVVPGDPTPENENCLWQKERRERTYGVADVETQAIQEVLTRQNTLEYTNPVVLSGSAGIYSGSYAVRRMSKPYSVDIDFSNSLHGGINYSQNKDRDMITPQIAVGNSSNMNTPENVVLIGAGSGNGTNPKPECMDETKPEELRKYKYDGFAVLGRETNLPTLEPKSDDNHYLYRQKISKIIPGNIVSSSVNTGYSALINKSGAQGGFGEGYNLVNLHSDTTDITNEISLQGPFTYEHVGGRQARHIHHMEGFSAVHGYVPNIALRPEAWNIYISELDGSETQEGSGTGDGALGFTTPDYSVGPIDTDQQKATLYREERAKRPVNIKNIQTIIGTGSHGNYTYGYEVMSTFGDQGYFLRRSDNLLPTIISNALPQTTNYFTLVSQAVTLEGNIFGEPNNRQYDNRIFSSGQAAAQATGGEFTVLGFARVTQGDFITIDSINYEIDDTQQGGETIAIESTNTAFYDGIETLLVNNFSNDFTIGYTETLTLNTAGQTGVTATGGEFTVLGFDDVVAGDFITIDSIDYEIDTSAQGGQTLLTTPTPASNTAFFNSLKSLLESNFPTNDFTVTFTEGDNGGQPPGSAGQALTITGRDQDICLNFTNTPSWSPSTSFSSTSDPWTISFYVNIPSLNSNYGGPRVIYAERGYGSPHTKAVLLQHQTINNVPQWCLIFAIGYVFEGNSGSGALHQLRYQSNGFMASHGNTLTHILITTEGDYGNKGTNQNPIPTETDLWINGTYVSWDDVFGISPTTGNAIQDFPKGADTNTSPFVDEITIGSLSKATSNNQGISEPGLTVVLDEIMIFDAYYDNSQNKIDDIYNNGDQLDYSNLTNLSSYSDLKAFYTFSETNDAFGNGDTVHNKVANSENLTVHDNSSDRISTSFSGPATAGTIVYHADFSIVPDNIGSYGNFIIALGAGSSFSNPQNSTNGVDFIPAIYDSEAEFTITPNNAGSYGNFIIALGAAGSSFLNLQSSTLGLDYIPPTVSGDTNIIQTQDRSIAASSVVRTRFSAPGGPEINSSGYLDIATQQYSVHNSLNFRNLTVRGVSSGENNIMRMDTHQVTSPVGRREGLRTLRARHSGQFGLDSSYATVPPVTYDEEASWHKQHRNSSMKITPQVVPSKGLIAIDATFEYMTSNVISPEGQIPAGSDSMTISFWFDSFTLNTNRQVLEITNSLFLTIPSSNSVLVSMIDSQGNARAAQAFFSNLDLRQWNQYIISIDFDDLFATRVEVAGLEPDSYQFSSSNFVNGWRGLGQESMNIGLFSVNSTTGLFGSIMNFCYFDSFIFDSEEDLTTLREHKRYADIRGISSLVNFWSFGEELSLSIGDTIQDGTLIQSSHTNMEDTFTFRRLIPNQNGSLVVEGFYTHYDGSNQGDKTNDNDHINTPLPATDFQYSWVKNVIGNTAQLSQPILNRAPKNGLVPTFGGYVSAIDFPSISDVVGEACFDNESIDARVLLAPVFSYTSAFTLNVIQTGPNTSTDILFADLANLQFDGDYVGCCTLNKEHSIVPRYSERQYEPTAQLPTLYYSPNCYVELEYSVRRCAVEDSIIVILQNVSLVEPQISGLITYEIGGALYVSTSDLTLTMTQTINTPGAEFTSISDLDSILFKGISGTSCCSDVSFTILEEMGTIINTSVNDSPEIPYGYSSLTHSPGDTYTIEVRIHLCDNTSGIYEDIRLTIENVAPAP